MDEDIQTCKDCHVAQEVLLPQPHSPVYPGHCDEGRKDLEATKHFNPSYSPAHENMDPIEKGGNSTDEPPVAAPLNLHDDSQEKDGSSHACGLDVATDNSVPKKISLRGYIFPAVEYRTIRENSFLGGNDLGNTSCLTSSAGTGPFADHNYCRHVDGNFTCLFCDTSFSHINRFITHMQIRAISQVLNGGVCKGASSNNCSLSPQNNADTSGSKLNCVVCDEAFVEVKSLKTHMHSHRQPQTTKCELCHKSYKTSGSLKKHMRIHFGWEKYKCDICNELFPSRSRLKRHRSIHAGQKLFECDMCSKLYPSSSSLRVHKRAHAGAKKFKCEVCDKSFMHNSQLSEHALVHTEKRSDILKADLFKST